MNLGYYFKTLLTTLNPNSYKSLTNRKLTDCFNHFFFAIVLSLIVFIILFVPYVFMVSGNIDATFQKISALQLDVELDTTQPLILSSTPEIILDLNTTNFTKGDVLITKDFLYYKSYILFGEDSIDLNELANLKQHQDRAKSIIIIALVFLLPAVLFGLFLFLAVKALAMAILVSFIAFIVFKLTHYNIKLSAIFKTALLATGIVVLLDVVLILFYPILWVPMVLYLLLFILASWSIAQKRFSIRQRKQKEYPEK